MVTPSPETCWLRPRLTVRPPISSPNRVPAAAAAAIPSQRSPVNQAVVKPTMAPSSMMPSIPRLSTPARSVTISPRVASKSGVATRITAAKKPTCRI